MVRIKRVSKNDPFYNLGYRWQIIDKYGTDIAHTLPNAIRYWLWHRGVSPKIAFWKWKRG
jgi:hypothetical protein